MLGTLLRNLFGARADSSPSPRPERRDGPRLPTTVEATLWWVPGEDGGEPTERCRQIIHIRDQSENGVGVSMENELPIGQSVRIVTARLDEFGVVRHCKATEDGYSASVVLVKHKSRRFERQPCREPATLRLSRPFEGRDQWPVTVLDSTPYGVQLRVAVRIPERACVKVVHAEWQCLGSVCYSKLEEDSYIVGIHLIGELITDDSAEF